MTAGTLFSGIGAPEHSTPEIEWKWCAEIEAFPSLVLKRRHKGVRNLGDVTKVNWREVESVDAVVFGSPCQGFSVAGKRLGLDDPRGNLALIALAAIAHIKPSWIVFENVPGLFSSWSGAEEMDEATESRRLVEFVESNDFASFCCAVAELGFHLVWTVLDAQHTGVPQRRRRIFAVGHTRDWRGPFGVLFDPARLQGHTPPRKEARKGSAAPTDARAGRRRFWAAFARAFTQGAGSLIPGIVSSLTSNSGIGRTGADPAHAQAGHIIPQAFGGGNCSGEIDVATCQTHHGVRLDFDTETFVTHPLRADGFDATEDGTGRGTPIIPVAYRVHSENSNAMQGNGSASAAEPAEVARALDTTGGYTQGQGGNVVLQPVVAFSAKDHGADAMEDISPTLRAMEYDGSHANGGGQLAVAFRASGQDGFIPDTVSPPITNTDGGGAGVPTACIPFDTTQITSRHNRSNPQPGDPCHTLAGSAKPPALAFETRYARNGRGAPDTVASPLKAESGRTGKGDGAPCVIAPISFIERGRDDGRNVECIEDQAYSLTNPGKGGRTDARHIMTPTMAVRRLTPIECARLMGFPDTYAHIYRSRKKRKISAEVAAYYQSHGLKCFCRNGQWYTLVAADGPIYRAYGNSMAVPAISWILMRMIAMHEVLERGQATSSKPAAGQTPAGARPRGGSSGSEPVSDGVHVGASSHAAGKKRSGGPGMAGASTRKRTGQVPVEPVH